jgi:hypothetical protein
MNYLYLSPRRLTRQQISGERLPAYFFENWEETLRKNLSHHWTVEEMAALVGLGTTAFSD